jgi:spastin
MNQWQQGVLDRLRALESGSPNGRPPVAGGAAAAGGRGAGGGGVGGGRGSGAASSSPILRPQLSGGRQHPLHAAAAAASPGGTAHRLLAPGRPAGGSKEDREFDERVLSEVLDSAPSVEWRDVAGLAAAKQASREGLLGSPMLQAAVCVG